jgi:pSer/pThr/pTyr-binding forkhead associated (FHA) protein
MNDASSRSHAIFTITFTQATYSADLPCETVSKINLVDLAGSERASATGAEGIRLTEGGNINRSLVSLGNVISALAEQSSHPSTQRHIPYRDSVLTWLLKDSLGGNSKTIMIATVSPAMCNYGETLSTLRYASRAKNIVNKPVVNEDPNVRLIRDLRAEIKRLKMIITDGNFDVSQPGSTKTVTELFSEDIQRKENQIAQLTKTWAGKWEGYQNIIEDSNLALHSEGIKMTVASELPHFLAVDDDALGTGVVIYRLQHEHTSIGAAGSSPRPDIELNGLDIESPHCVVEHVSGKVYLTPHDGTTSVNTDLVTSKIKLTHGDIVQFGSSTVFRFNHPQEAAEMKEKDETRARGRLLELSPVSPKDMLEEQRLAIERHYEEKLESMRREMESRNQHEKERLMKELEKLKISSSVEIPSVQVGDEGAPLGSPGAEDDPYQVMKSIGYQPIDSRRQRTTSIRIKDITGGEVAAHSYSSTDSPVPALRFSPSPSPDTPVQSHELPLLSPATGQHNAVPERVSDSPIDPELNKILETYEILHDTCGIPSVQHTPPMDTFDGVPDFTTSSQYDLGYGSRNMAQSRADSCLSASCPQGPSTFQPDGDTVDEQQDDLRTVEQELDNVGELVRDGVVYRRKRGDTERVRKLAKKLTRDVDQLRKEKDDYSV